VCDLTPLLKISQCVPLGSLSVFHYSDIEDTTVMLQSEYACADRSTASALHKSCRYTRGFVGLLFT
jgi:hypothetical protein